MAYERYVPEFTDKDGQVYGVMDAEAREAIVNLNNNKLPKNFGAENAGKALIVGNDGNVISGEAGGIDFSDIVFTETTTVGADASNKHTIIAKNTAYLNSITPRPYMENGYIKVSRGSADITKWVYDDGEIDVKDAFDDISVEAIAHEKTPEKTVDICLFSGQSNMSGRGTASEAIVCPHGEGYWWHNNQFEDIVDPVGNETGISTGTMIPAICKSYFDTTGVPIVAVVNAIGGTEINYWLPDTGAYNNSVAWVNAAKTYAENNGYTVRKIIMAWNQGENDVSDGTSKSDYKTRFKTMCDALMTATGIQTVFIIKIGQHKTNDSYDFTDIRSAQDELGDENKNFVVVSDKFRGPKELMKDAWHFKQDWLNITGLDAGKNMGYYELTGVKPLCDVFTKSDSFDQNAENVEEFDLTGWSNTEYARGIGIKLYTGSAKKVSVPANAKVGDYVVPIFIDLDSGYNHGFRDNTTIEEVDISSDVKLAQGGASSIQNIGRFFQGCTSLKKVTSFPDISEEAETRYCNANSMYQGCSMLTELVFPENATNMSDICNGCTSLTEIPAIPQSCTNLMRAFYNCTFSHLPDIPDNCDTMSTIFLINNNLVSVGKIGTGMTNMASAFRYCPNLAGTVRIESPDVSNMSSAFHASAIPNITFQVPANSTTYTTLTTAYPTAHVETF